MTDILDLIDNAIEDYATSGDAMRWTPDVPEPVCATVWIRPHGESGEWTYLGHAASASFTIIDEAYDVSLADLAVINNWRGAATCLSWSSDD